MESTKYIGKPADRNSGVYTLSEINEKIQDQTYPTNYEIENSCRFDGISSRLSFSPTSDSSYSGKGTFSSWLKVTANSGTNGGTFIGAADTNHYGQFYNEGYYFGNAVAYIGGTTPKIRDYSAWYHVLFVFDTTLQTNRLKIYVNNILQTGGQFNTEPSQNSNFIFLNTTQSYNIGSRQSSNYFNGYIADVHFIDGQALDPTHFAHEHPSTGRWSPKRYQGTYGTNGFHLEFKNTGTHTGVGGIGEDTSGNGNHWAVTGLAAHDITQDSPSNNFATLNRLMLRGGTLSEGNLKLSGGGNYTGSFANLLIPKTGKYYVEVRTNDTTDDHALCLFPNNLEFSLANQSSTNSIYITSYGGGISVLTNSNTTTLGSVSETATTSGDVHGYLVDVGNGLLGFYKNGVHKLTLTNWSPLDLEYAIGYNVNTTWPACNKTFNFGQDPTFAETETPTRTYSDANNRGKFLYPPPAGALALCEKNLVQPQDSVSEYLVDNTKTKTLTYTGNAIISKFTPYAQDGYSLYSSTAGLKLTNTASDFDYLHNNTTDYTISFWMYRVQDVGASEILIDSTGGTTNAHGFNMIVDGGGTDKLRMYINRLTPGSSAFKFESDYVVPLRQWVHVTFVFDQSVADGAADKGKLYVNGKLLTGTYQNLGSYSTSNASQITTIGSEYNGNTHFYGYIADFRIVKNKTVTTDPPLSPYSVSETDQDILISASSNMIKDSDTTGTAYTVTPVGSGEVAIEAFSPYTSKDIIPDHSVHGGSFYFNGASNIKTIDSTDWNPDAGDFTVEGWYYLTETGNYYFLWGTGGSDGNEDFAMRVNTNNTIGAYLRNSAGNILTLGSTNIVTKNTWNHIALERYYNEIKIYLNGVAESNTFNATSWTGFDSETGLTVGAFGEFTGGGYWHGYIADFRFVKGTAIYQGNFTPPTAKLTNVTNTKYLLQPYHTTPAHGVLETLDAYNIEETGKQLIYHKQAKVISSRPFTGIKIGSVAIGGANGDGIEIPSTTDFTFGTGAFTVEMWVRPTNTTSSNGRVTLISHRNANQGGLDTTQWAWFINDNNFEIHDIGAITVNGGGEFGASGDSLNKWHHVVWCRDNTSMRFYVNGILKKTIGYASYNPNYSTDRLLTIGSDTLVDSTLDGFITDVRIVKGQALYVNTFTPPAHPLSSTHYTTDGTDPITSSTKQTISGTVSLLLQPGKTTSISEVAVKSEKHFNTVLYRGTGQTQSITGLDFQLDLVWIKGRDATRVHIVSDSVRGITYYLIPNITNGETNISGGVADNLVKSTSTTGFTIGSDSAVNFSSEKFVAWCWRAGGTPSGATSALGSAMIDGVAQKVDDIHSAAGSSLKPTLISASTTAGFGIVTYSIPSSTPNDNHFTIPHGLNKTPEVIIVKNTVQPGHSGSQMWCVYHHSEPTKTGFLNRTLAFTTQENTNNFNGTVPTSQVFTVGHPSNNNSGDTCRDGNSYVAYAWHSFPGYSAFGSYVGNGTSDGPFVYTGFRPSFVMIKNTSATADWIIIDSARDEFNSTTGHALYPSLNFTEANLTVYALDLLSNGFKIRNNSTEMNRNGNTDTFIYMAFAEQPFTRNRAR